MTDIRPSAMELLVDYDWPGNIRELENVIQGAVILTDGDSITADHLPRGLQQWQNGPVLVCNGDNSDGSFEERLRQYRLALVNQAIAECHGNKAMAARNLGISRPYLHRLIRGEGEAAAMA